MPEALKIPKAVPVSIYRLIALADQNRWLQLWLAVSCWSPLISSLIAFYSNLCESHRDAFGFETRGICRSGYRFCPWSLASHFGDGVSTSILVIPLPHKVFQNRSIFMKDLTSLIYVWFLIASGAHAGVINFMGKSVWWGNPGFQLHFLRSSAPSLLFHFHSPLCPINIIAKIYGNNMDLIKSLVTKKPGLRKNESVVSSHCTMFESLNQLDDISNMCHLKNSKAISFMTWVVPCGITWKSNLISTRFLQVTQKRSISPSKRWSVNTKKWNEPAVFMSRSVSDWWTTTTSNWWN